MYIHILESARAVLVERAATVLLVMLVERYLDICGPTVHILESARDVLVERAATVLLVKLVEWY